VETSMAHTLPKSGARHRPSAVSQVLRAWQEDPAVRHPLWKLEAGTTGSGGLHVHVASDRSTRERAYRLAHEIYRSRGYVQDAQASWCVAPYDAQTDVLTLLARQQEQRDVGTVTLVPDSATSLPCDEIYRPETEALRAQGCRLAEVTRLVIADDCPSAKDVLLTLFNLAYLYARRINTCTDLVIEVNPRHVAYYQKLLLFEQAGPERPCPRVQGAPAVLLKLNLAAIEATVKETGSTNGRDFAGKRLHRYPFSELEETRILRELLRQQRPMSSADARYFAIA